MSDVLTVGVIAQSLVSPTLTKVTQAT